MIYLISYGTKAKKDIWAGRYHCPNCGQPLNFHLYKIKHYASVSYIPLFSITSRRLVVCDRCQQGRKLSRIEYNNIRKTQSEKLKANEFPPDVISSDFNPKELKYIRKLLLLFAASLYALCMVIAAVSMATEVSQWDMSVPVVILLILAMSLLPLRFAVKSVADASHKRKLYLSTLHTHP